MSAAGASSQYHAKFKEFFFKTFTINFPKCKSDEEKSINSLEEFLRDNHENVCALIIEPLVQGAAGMKMFSPGFLDEIVQTVRKYGILVIFDEVMTGFFRTGTMFAMDQVRNKPDIVCLSKALTGGFLPLALTITSEEIYNSFLSDDWSKAFIHGHSYTANPIACAAACKAQEILQSENMQRNIKMISETHVKRLSNISHKNILSTRSKGTISAIDVKTPAIAKSLERDLLEHGVLIRPINNSVYFIPPYCISEQNLNHAYDMLERYMPQD